LDISGWIIMMIFAVLRSAVCNWEYVGWGGKAYIYTTSRNKYRSQNKASNPEFCTHLDILPKFYH